MWICWTPWRVCWLTFRALVGCVCLAWWSGRGQLTRNSSLKWPLTLKITTAQVVETSVTNNSLSKDYPHPDDHARQTIVSNSIYGNFGLATRFQEERVELPQNVTYQSKANHVHVQISISAIRKYASIVYRRCRGTCEERFQSYGYYVQCINVRLMWICWTP